VNTVSDKVVRHSLG